MPDTIYNVVRNVKVSDASITPAEKRNALGSNQFYATSTHARDIKKISKD